MAPATPRTRAPRREAPPLPVRSRIPLRLLALAAVIVVAAIGGFVTLGSSSVDQRYSCGEIVAAPSGGIDPLGIEQPDLGNAHVAATTSIHYARCPPTSGSHYAALGVGPIRPGFYGPNDVAWPGGWVHNLEHGYIVALYTGTPDGDTLAALRRFVDLAPATETATRCGYRAKVIVARFNEMSTPFSVLAWDHLLQLPAWDETAALTFAGRWLEQSIERAAC